MRQGWRVPHCRRPDRRNHPKLGTWREPNARSPIPNRLRRRPPPNRAPLPKRHRRPARREIPEQLRWNPLLRERRPPKPPRIQDRPPPSIRRNPTVPFLRPRKPPNGPRRFGRPRLRPCRKRPGPPQAKRNHRPCRCSAGNRPREPAAQGKAHRPRSPRIAAPLPGIVRSLQRPPRRFPKKLRRRRKRYPALRPTPGTNPG